MSTWTEDMADVFTDLVAEFGDTLTFNGNSMVCVKTGLAVSFEMEVSGSSRLVDTAIDVRRTDAISFGLYLPEWKNNPPVKRPIVTVSQVKFMVISWEDDITADPTIKIKCAKLQ